ncbi:solute carrier organic anion transporter family member 6A1-like [Talpa occidentalis]|uniref:solute carrier organic anion transporter family member 6A1-like n=1 Tax=Talpa occidentalis TaxID=50954 RepID=UPI0023F9122D|nr:solute carrier organic anion transporter family member 6A1-like [Talpa occidentalis]
MAGLSVQAHRKDGTASKASGLTIYPARSSVSHTPAMEGDLVEVEPQEAQVQSSQENGALEKVDTKSSSYVMTVANRLIRFYNLRKKGASTRKAKKRQENLDTPCGLGSIIIPSWQRFNNVHCFLVFYCLLVISQDMCVERKIPYVCKRNTMSSQSKYVTYFILGQILQGIAAIPIYIAGIIFLDGSVTTHSSGIYLGCVESSLTVGYALGYTIGAPLTNTLENDTVVKSSGNNSSTQHWHQSWWLNYMIVSVTSWSTLIPLLCFPPSIRGTAKIKAAKLKEPQLDILKDQELGTRFKDLFAAVWILLKTPIFLFLALCRASESLVLIAGAEFLPRYIESQFILTPQEATTLTGIILIPGGAIGRFLGGVIASKLEMSCKALMRFIIITSAVTIILLIFLFFVHCNSIPFAGINEDYAGTGQLGNLTAPCNSHCQCSSSVYSAICGRDDIGYFSPCYAGCAQSKTINDHEVYYNCSCIKHGLITPDEQGDSIDARSGTCDPKCYKLPLFLAFVLSTIVFSCFTGIPSILTILRIVSEKHRAIALGLSYVVVRLFGSIPGPALFKLAREDYCIFRDIDNCGVTGNCWLYNKTKMMYLFGGLSGLRNI